MLLTGIKEGRLNMSKYHCAFIATELVANGYKTCFQNPDYSPLLQATSSPRAGLSHRVDIFLYGTHGASLLISEIGKEVKE
ncbi:UNVERIFIED_CONTAM: hypothetical protein K2H54_036261 [Gekko kuhli]